MAQQGVEKVGFDKHNFARTGRMALYGGGKSKSSHPPTPPQSTITGPNASSPHSNLRPRRHNLVRLPRTPHQLPLPPEPHHRRARPHRPDRFRLPELGVFSEQYGDHGGQ